MIPVTYPSQLNTYLSSREMIGFYLSSVTGLQKWTDYIPVKLIQSSSSLEGRTDATGYMAVSPLSSVTGLTKWKDYVPLFVDNSLTVPWSTDANGYIPVSFSSVGALSSLLTDGHTVANYQKGIGITGTTNASAWANQIGAAGPLLQATGGNQPAIQADGSLLFDGISQYMKTAIFTLVHPETFYLVLKQVTWVSAAQLFDGNASNSAAIRQAFSGTPVTPQIESVGSLMVTSSLAVGAYGVITYVINGASSLLQIDSNSPVTGTDVSDAGGFTLGTRGAAGGQFSNIQVKEIIIRNVADSAGTQAQIQAYLKAIHGTP